MHPFPSSSFVVVVSDIDPRAALGHGRRCEEKPDLLCLGEKRGKERKGGKRGGGKYKRLDGEET